MSLDLSDTAVFRADALKRRVSSSVLDSDAYKAAAKEPSRFRIFGADPREPRPDMRKAREAALKAKMNESASGTDLWVQEIVDRWCGMSGLPRADAAFWRERGFMDAVREGHDLQIRRYIGEDGWAWIAVRDTSGSWMNRKRLPEHTRQQMLAVIRDRGLVRR